MSPLILNLQKITQFMYSIQNRVRADREQLLRVQSLILHIIALKFYTLSFASILNLMAPTTMVSAWPLPVTARYTLRLSNEESWIEPKFFD